MSVKAFVQKYKSDNPGNIKTTNFVCHILCTKNMRYLIGKPIKEYAFFVSIILRTCSLIVSANRTVVCLAIS